MPSGPCRNAGVPIVDPLTVRRQAKPAVRFGSQAKRWVKFPPCDTHLTNTFSPISLPIPARRGGRMVEGKKACYK